MMRKLICLLVALVMIASVGISVAETTLSGHAQMIFDSVRWNLNLPKQSNVVHAEEYLYKMNKEITLHALLVEVTVSQDLQNMYGGSAKLMLIDLDTGDVIDYANFDGNVMWPENGDVTSKYDAMHLLYSSYWSYCEFGVDYVMDGYHEFITPIAEEDIAAINAALTEAFVRPAE